MVKVSEQSPPYALQPTKAPEGQTSQADPFAAAIHGQSLTCARAFSCCGPGARTAKQKVGGAAFFLALVALILAKVYGII